MFSLRKSLLSALPQVHQSAARTFASAAATSSSGSSSVEFVGLSNLSDNPGAIKRGKRLGRGIGSGKGKTSGRGHKGQKARAGGKSGRGPGFEGGQTPLYRRIPKRGFNNSLATPLEPLNLNKLQFFIDMGRIDPTQPITLKVLYESGIIGKFKHGVKLLGDGADVLRQPIDISVSRASKTAIEGVEKAGGIIESRYFNRLGLRAHLKPHKFDVLPKQARPKPKLMPYYTNYENRGYLSPEMNARRLETISEEE